jgi:hypothetical protein
MSAEVCVFIQDSRVPSRNIWQKELKEAGFPVILDPMLNLRECNGSSTTLYNGQDCEFELHLEPAADYVKSHPGIAREVGDRNLCASFRWGHDLREFAVAISAAAALTRLTDGIYYDPESENTLTANKVYDGTRQVLSLF